MDFRSLTAGIALKRKPQVCVEPSISVSEKKLPQGPSLDFFEVKGKIEADAKTSGNKIRNLKKGVVSLKKADGFGETDGVILNATVGNDAETLQLFQNSGGVTRVARHATEDKSSIPQNEDKALRRQLGLKVSGLSPPSPMVTFSSIPKTFSKEVLNWLACGSGSGARLSARLESTREAIMSSIEVSYYKEPTAVQMQAIPALLEGRDVLACAPTGSGKTAAFLIPLLLLLQNSKCACSGAGPRALIIVPTRELASQIVREANRLGAGLGLHSVCLTRENVSGTAGRRISASEAGDLVRRKRRRSDILSGGEDLGGSSEGGEEDEDCSDLGPSVPRKEDHDNNDATVVVPPLPRGDILVSTPLLLASVLRSATPTVKSDVSYRAIIPSLRHLILDEVDSLLEAGFVNQVDEIFAALPTPPLLLRLALASQELDKAALFRAAAPSCSVQIGMFTATLPSGIEELAITALKNPVRILAGKAGATATPVSQRLLFVGKEAGKVMALKGMLSEGVRPPVLIFVQSKERAEQVSKVLELEGVRVGVIHADRSMAQREEAILRFRRGDTLFLVTTDVLGRGLDFKGVNLVLNFDLPQSAVAYVHRVGRTGRAGREGEAVTFFTEEDIPLLRSIANVMKLSGCEVPPWMLQIQQLSQRDKKALSKSAPYRKHLVHGDKKRRR